MSHLELLNKNSFSPRRSLDYKPSFLYLSSIPDPLFGIYTYVKYQIFRTKYVYGDRLGTPF